MTGSRRARFVQQTQIEELVAGMKPLAASFQSSVFEREMAGAHVLGRDERGSVPFPDDPAAIKDREPVGNGGADGQTLLDEQYGQARGLQLSQNLEQAIDDDGGETFGWLI
jgi:hypothetical protein